MKKTPKVIAIKILVILLIIWGGFFALKSLGIYHTQEEYNHAIAQPTDFGGQARVRFIVEPGMSTKAIANKLQSTDLTPYPWAFIWYVEENNLDGKLQAGEYLLTEGQTIPQIATDMLTAKKKETIVTVPEGMRLTQIDNIFAKSGLIQDDELLENKLYIPEYGITQDMPAGLDIEGYLYPETYYFDTDETTARGIIERLTWEMGTRFDSAMRARAAELGMTMHEILTLASLIERESFSAKESPEIASVMYNRLDNNMRLDIDATTQYAVDDYWKRPLTSEDLASTSPYNTRKVSGLPPGPICSPSLDSIKAALYPADTDYFYYLHDADGQVHFATTNDEHNRNKRKYL